LTAKIEKKSREGREENQGGEPGSCPTTGIFLSNLMRGSRAARGRSGRNAQNQDGDIVRAAAF
jgi:hypothetical protein